MVRPKLIEKSVIMSVRISEFMDQLLGDIAAIESLNTGNLVSKQELVRAALEFVYNDNERLRECFRRSRENHTKRQRKPPKTSSKKKKRIDK